VAEDLKNNGYEIHMMWILSHVRVRGNERAVDVKISLIWTSYTFIPDLQY
jgi:hypothetical protein